MDKPELFQLDEERNPLFVAGVPADQFSATGQLWGNPLYAWEEHKKQGYAWWIHRIEESFKIYDVLRIDHFKGFSDYWQVDGKAEVAKDGSWQLYQVMTYLKPLKSNWAIYRLLPKI